MQWVYLLIASVFEICWPVGMKLTQKGGSYQLCGIIMASVGMIFAVFFLYLAQRTMAIGTSYAIWTGLGAAGTFIAGLILFGESASMMRFAGVALIISGVVVLKFAH